MEIFWKRRIFKLWFFWNGDFLEVEIFLKMEIFWKRRFFKLWFFWNGEFLEVEIFLRVGIFCSVEILLNDGIRLRWKIFFTNVWRCRLCNVDKKREKDKRGWKDRRWMKPVLTYYEPIVLVYCVQNKYTRIKKNRKSCDEMKYQSSTIT